VQLLHILGAEYLARMEKMGDMFSLMAGVVATKGWKIWIYNLHGYRQVDFLGILMKRNSVASDFREGALILKFSQHRVQCMWQGRNAPVIQLISN